MTLEMVGKILLRGILGKILLAIYLVVGLIVASSHPTSPTSTGSSRSSRPSVLLWPLVLFGLKLVIK
jgi:hypothetical protein